MRECDFEQFLPYVSILKLCLMKTAFLSTNVCEINILCKYLSRNE